MPAVSRFIHAVPSFTKVEGKFSGCEFRGGDSRRENCQKMSGEHPSDCDCAMGVCMTAGHAAFLLAG
jgi:hypothetical protein